MSLLEESIVRAIKGRKLNKEGIRLSSGAKSRMSGLVSNPTRNTFSRSASSIIEELQRDGFEEDEAKAYLHDIIAGL